MKPKSQMQRDGELQQYLSSKIHQYRQLGYQIALPATVTIEDEQEIDALLANIAAHELAQREAAARAPAQVPGRQPVPPSAFPRAVNTPRGRDLPASAAEQLSALTDRDAIAASIAGGAEAVARHRAAMHSLLGRPPPAPHDIAGLTSPDAVRNGTYAANRERLLASVQRSGVVPGGEAFATMPRGATRAGAYPPSYMPRRSGVTEIPHGLPSAIPADVADRLLQRKLTRGS